MLKKLLNPFVREYVNERGIHRNPALFGQRRFSFSADFKRENAETLKWDCILKETCILPHPRKWVHSTTYMQSVIKSMYWTRMSMHYLNMLLFNPEFLNLAIFKICDCHSMLVGEFWEFLKLPSPFLKTYWFSLHK